MKKNFVSLLLAIITMFVVVAMPVHAASDGTYAVQTCHTEDGYTIYTFEDGSTLRISPVYLQEKGLLATAQTINPSREATFSDENGVLQWRYVLHATFSYVYGVSSTCTGATYSKTIYGSGWTFSNGSATRSGNTAYGKGVFTKTSLLVFTKDYNVNISLSCDIYGNVT